MTNIGISTASLFLKSEVEDSFDIIRKLNCEVVEVFLTTFSEYEKAFVESLVPRKQGLTIHSVHSLNNHYEPELFNQSQRTYNDAVTILRKVLYGAKVLGAKYYTFHGQARLKSKPYNVNFESLGKRLTEICNICSEYDVELCYENVHWTYCSTPTYFDNIKRLCPDLGAVLDIKQAMQSGIDWREFLKVQKDRLCTVHVCDYDESGLAIPGRGSFDFVEFFARLMDAGYDGPCLMEVYDKNYDDIAQLKESYLYLCDCLDRAQNK